MEFLVIGAVGLGLLVVTLVIGEFFDVHGVVDSDIFSIASISAFLGAFGFSAAAVDSATDRLLVSIPVGVVVGLLFSALTVWLTRSLKNSRTDATVNTNSLVGHEARVLTAIPATGHGEVTVRVGGHLVKYSARSATPLDAGTRVWVSNVLSATALEVSPVDAVGGPPDLAALDGATAQSPSSPSA